MSLNCSTNTPCLHPPDIYEYGESQWDDIDKVKAKNPKKTCPNATLLTTNPTWTDLGAILSLHGEKSATNRLSHGTVLAYI
jgi:hypothetical protein